MAFWVKNNPNVNIKWRNVVDIFYYGFIILSLLRLITEMRDKANYTKSLLLEVLNYSCFIFISSYFLLNIIHWLKPKWFENKAQ